jgi:hypothetical protein
VQFEVFDIDFEEWVVPSGCEDFQDEAAVRIKAASAAAPRVDRPASMPSIPAAATAACAGAATSMSEGVPPPGSVAVGGLNAMSGSSAAALTSGHAVSPPVVRAMDLTSNGSGVSQLLTSDREGGEGPLGIFSPRPSRQRPTRLPAVVSEDEVSAEGEGPDRDELVAQQFFEATTGRSIETEKAVPLSERPQTFDLSGPDVWAGAPIGGADQQKSGRLNRIKRSASISVV